MSVVANIPVYFSGFAPYLMWGANMGEHDCTVSLDNSNGEYIKDGCAITYDWNNPTVVKIKNANEDEKTLTLQFMQSDGNGGYVDIESPETLLQFGNLTVQHQARIVDASDVFYANKDVLTVEVTGGDVVEGFINSIGHDGCIDANPNKGNTTYGGWYEEYVVLNKTGTYTMKFKRQKMAGTFTITVNYTELEA